MSVELATAYVNIQASTKGLGRDITSTMGGAGTDGGQVAAQGFRQKFTGGLKGIGKVAGPLLGLGLGVPQWSPGLMAGGRAPDGSPWESRDLSGDFERSQRRWVIAS